MLRDIHHPTHLHRRHPRLLRDLLRSRLNTRFLRNRFLNISQLRHRLDHVHRDTNRPRMICNRTRNRLTDPPCRIGTKLVPTLVFKLINRSHQPSVPLLDHIKKTQTTVAILLRDRDNQPKVPPRKIPLCLLILPVHCRDLSDPIPQILRLVGHQRPESIKFLTQHLKIIIAVLLGIHRRLEHLSFDTRHLLGD